jgi:hypothetical protein
MRPLANIKPNWKRKLLLVLVLAPAVLFGLVFNMWIAAGRFLREFSTVFASAWQGKVHDASGFIR